MSRKSGKIPSEFQAEPLLHFMNKTIHTDRRAVGTDGIPPLSETVLVIYAVMQNDPYVVTGGVTSRFGLVLLQDGAYFI